MIACFLIVLSNMPFTVYAANLSQTSAFDTYNLSGSEHHFSLESEDDFKLGVIAPCPEDLIAMGWFEGLVICSSDVGLQPLVDDLINDLESIQESKLADAFLEALKSTSIILKYSLSDDHNNDLKDSVVIFKSDSIANTNHNSFKHLFAHDKVYEEIHLIAGVTEAVLYALLAYCKAYGCP